MDLVLFGAGDFAEIAAYYFERDSQYTVKAFTVDAAHLKEPTLGGKPVIPFEEITAHYPVETTKIFVALGFSKLNKLRADKFFAAKAKGYSLASYCSSRISALEPLELQENTFIFEDNTIQPFVKIGANVIVWSGNHIGHHASIGDHCFVTSHVCIAGRASIGEYCFLGINATIRDNITIGSRSIIGAGALIMADAEEESVFSVKGDAPRSIKSRDVSF